MSKKFIFGGSYTSFQYLFDLYGGANLGFSVRKLSEIETMCMRVRRDSDNTEQDFGFVNNLIDTASLLLFVGSGSGYVTIWYNQGFLANATQTIASKQPRIVNSGVLETKNGNPALAFSGNQFLELPITTDVNIDSQLYSYAVSSVNNFAGVKMVYSLGNQLPLTGRYAVFYNGSVTTGFVRPPSADSFASLNTPNFNQNINQLFIRKNIDNRLLINNVEGSRAITGDITATFNYIKFRIGAYSQFDGVGAEFYHVGTIQELVNYYDDKEVVRNDIRNNMNNFYGTY
jgi:hypothetical protein